MAEKLQKKETIERSNTAPDTEDGLWLADAISTLQKEAALSNEEAALVLYGRTLGELKDLVAGNKSPQSIYEDNLEQKVSKTVELSIILRQILGDDKLNDLKKVADSNKFRSIKISTDQGDVAREKFNYTETTGGRVMKDSEATEQAICKKVVDILLTRLFVSDGAQNMADILTLAEEKPESAADLGKIVQAAEIIARCKKHVKKIMKREAEKRAIITNAKERALENTSGPILYAKELFGGTKYSLEEPNKLFGGFYRRIKELEDQAEEYKTSEDVTIN